MDALSRGVRHGSFRADPGRLVPRLGAAEISSNRDRTPMAAAGGPTHRSRPGEETPC